MQPLSELLDRADFDGLAITKTPAGYAASLMKGTGQWSPDCVGNTPGEALGKLLAPIVLPPSPALPPLPY